jgi:N-methylhydantoinase B/oxoprolinase/acetone carboxylase alpha subunit
MKRFDPVRLSIYQHLLAACAEEMGAALGRSASSANIKERRDYSCAVFDDAGRMIAQAAHIPVHLGSMPLSVAAALKRGPLERGDAVLVNDPYEGGTHLPDITLVAPVFLPGEPRGRPAFYVANRAHHSDVGGMSPGSMPVASEIYQEGLIIPPVRLVRRGQMVKDILALVLANVRTPDERQGDLTAQIAANRVAETRLQELVARHGRKKVVAYGAALQDYTERVVRAMLKTIPAGDYTFEDALDDDGFVGSPVKICARVRIHGGRAEIDFTGSAPQVQGSVNANYAITLSACLYCLRCLITEDVLYNAGVARPLRVVAPPGSIVNAARPGAVAGGNVETSQRITDVVFGALSRALPARLQAASQGTMNNVTLGGLDPRTGARFAYYETLGGGMGGRRGLAGLSGVHTHMSNTRNTPVEAIENYLPVRIRRYGLRCGSGGKGAFPGGEGLVREYEMLVPTSVTILSDRRRLPPYGLRGGRAGARGRNTLVRRRREQVLPGKVQLELQPGDRLRIETPGGGGYGRPSRI